MVEQYVTNPSTGRPIRVGSVVYNRLVSKGLMVPVETNKRQKGGNLKDNIENPTPKPPTGKSKAYEKLQQHVEEEEQVNDTHLQTTNSNVVEENEVKPKSQKIKKPLKTKIDEILSNAHMAYYETLKNLPQDLPEDCVNNLIKEELIKNLKKSNCKYIRKYLPTDVA